jgi:hypothetical protein
LTTGGAVTGGVATGGVVTGGTATGGTTGGTATGGVATGGDGTGGANTGGTATGGDGTGGDATGGANTGGTATGGSATGGAASCDPNRQLDPATLALNRLRVDATDQFRPATRAASGSLYGLAREGEPADELIQPLRPFTFTQMPPGGEQQPNGTGDTLGVAAMAARAGATITIRLPDIYPTFPYSDGWTSWDDWYQRVDTMITATVNSGATNIRGYEIWNEPDWTFPETGVSFFEVWRQTHERIRAIDPNTPIMGPSHSFWLEVWMRDFLEYGRDNDCLPDIVSWNELGNPEGHHENRAVPLADYATSSTAGRSRSAVRPIRL